MRQALLVGVLLLLTGCGAEFERNRMLWNTYRNSPAAQHTIYTNTYSHGGQTTTCDTVCGRYDCETTCYGP